MWRQRPGPLIVGLVVLVLLATVEAAAQGRLVQRTEVPSAIAFWDSRHGLLGTGTCVAAVADACRTGTIQLTSDGGRTFRVVLRTRRPVVGLQTAGSRAAIATTHGGGSFLTLDRGRSWRPYRLRYGASFATPRSALGFRTYRVLDHPALALLATSDGGRTWRRRASPCKGAVAFEALVELVTPRLGWIICLGQPGAGNQEKTVFETTDGGRSWRRRASAVQGDVHGGIAGYGYPQGVAFAADGFGLLWESRGSLYVTRDGGARWIAKPSVAQPEIDFGRGAAALARGRGVVLLGRGAGRPARLLATDDAGGTWRLVKRWGG